MWHTLKLSNARSTILQTCGTQKFVHPRNRRCRHRHDHVTLVVLSHSMIVLVAVASTSIHDKTQPQASSFAITHQRHNHHHHRHHRHHHPLLGSSSLVRTSLHHTSPLTNHHGRHHHDHGNLRLHQQAGGDFTLIASLLLLPLLLP